ncbi:DUF3131 domain-containing protein [Vibrio sp. TBV020]|uniref:DUF3131 domain-containing protein n=1 Tax=Vibrio sp. TBV020 TaxID=3137398 RepID=UPI0038CD1B9A
MKLIEHSACMLAITLIFVSTPMRSEDELSFYGQRNVIAPTPKTQETTTFHRRVIAPRIEDELADHKTDDTIPHDLTQHRPALDVQRALNRNELLLAKKAQYYFLRNERTETGLWDSVQGYPHTTMWDVASGIGALLAMEALGLRTTSQTHYDLRKTLTTLQTLPLYKDTLPNREYSTKTGESSGRLSSSKSNGSGWSALDIGRLLIWLKIVCQQHPDLIDEVATVVSNWQLSKAVNDGTLFGANVYKGKEYYRQEGRNGYLQYAAKGFELFNLPVDLPDLNKHLKTVNVEDIDIQIDTRNVPFLTSDPYFLASLEYEQNPDWSQLNQIYQLHKFVWITQNKVTSYAEDAMNKNPWFAYNNIYYYGKPWTSVSPAGKTIENPQVLSHKAAFAFSSLFDDEFSQVLFNEVLTSSRQYRSIPTGVYANGGSNSAFNINTNSLILVALWYRANGSQPILELR